tara:strand:- start:369 stop:608 length:240 start_codon:yes stop_codon:yes gene_type:complete
MVGKNAKNRFRSLAKFIVKWLTILGFGWVLTFAYPKIWVPSWIIPLALYVIFGYEIFGIFIVIGIIYGGHKEGLWENWL